MTNPEWLKIDLLNNESLVVSLPQLLVGYIAYQNRVLEYRALLGSERAANEYAQGIQDVLRCVVPRDEHEVIWYARHLICQGLSPAAALDALRRRYHAED